MNENIFDKLDFGPLRSLLDNDDITDISFDNNGQIWVRSLTQGSLRVEVEGVTPEFIEKLAFQCSNVMGTTFNNAKPFLDAESAELRLNFVHQSIATNGIAMVIRKTPAKIRLEKEKLLKEDYFTEDIHNFLIKCVEGHCNIIVCGETGSGKTEFVKYLASHTKTDEKVITIEDTLELHLDKIFPQRDIVAMKTNNVASYTDVLVTCMRQNPKWILLSEVRSAEAVSAVRNSISSGHNILSTIHADKASAIPYRLYSLMETDLDVNQFLTTIYRYIQLGVHIKAYYSKEKGRFQRELDEVVEFYVDDNNVPQSHTIYRKQFGKSPVMAKPSAHLIEYLENQNIDISSITSHMTIDEIPDYAELNTEGEKTKMSVDSSVTNSKEAGVKPEDNNTSNEATVNSEDNTSTDATTVTSSVADGNSSNSSTVVEDNANLEISNVNIDENNITNVNDSKLDEKQTENVQEPAISENEITNTNISVNEQPLVDEVVDNKTAMVEKPNNVIPTNDVITVNNSNTDITSQPQNTEVTQNISTDTNLVNDVADNSSVDNTIPSNESNSSATLTATTDSAVVNTIPAESVTVDQPVIQGSLTTDSVSNQAETTLNNNTVPQAAIDIPIIQNINTVDSPSVDINNLSTLDTQVST